MFEFAHFLAALSITPQPAEVPTLSLHAPFCTWNGHRGTTTPFCRQPPSWTTRLEFVQELLTIWQEEILKSNLCLNDIQKQDSRSGLVHAKYHYNHTIHNWFNPGLVPQGVWGRFPANKVMQFLSRVSENQFHHFGWSGAPLEEPTLIPAAQHSAVNDNRTTWGPEVPKPGALVSTVTLYLLIWNKMPLSCSLP